MTERLSLTKIGVQAANAWQTWTPQGLSGNSFKTHGEIVINVWTFFRLVCSEVIGSQHHQLSGSSQPGVFVFVVSIELTSSTWWGGGLVSTEQLKGYGSEYYLWSLGSWHCLMAELLLFCLAYFPCFCIFSLLWLNLLSGLWSRLTFFYK